MIEKTLHFSSAKLLHQLYCGKIDNLERVERLLKIQVVTRDDWIKLSGNEDNVSLAEAFFNLLNHARSQGLVITNADFEQILEGMNRGEQEDLRKIFTESVAFKFQKKSVVPKTINQKRYLQAIAEHQVVFGVGPAGTGKTYLAVAAALDALLSNQVERVILARPAVEAGEALGFLPGDLYEKIKPYLRPLYDAMYDLIGGEQSEKLLQKEIVEIAPLAYMRGRTLSNSYIILDEAQNTTSEQMVMFLTRLGHNSRMIITGDVTQIDLPKNKTSGLKQAIRVLDGISTIDIFQFESKDVMRHPVVRQIIDAYDKYHRR